MKRTQDNHLQRAEGCGLMVLGGAQSGARIVELFQRSPIRILFPRVGDGALEEAVLPLYEFEERRRCRSNRELGHREGRISKIGQLHLAYGP